MGRDYVSIDNPPIELERMVHFLVYVWAPVYVKSKIMQNIGFSGPSLLLLELQLAKQHLNNNEFIAVLENISHNGFYALHENILVALLHSSIKAEQEQGINIILNLRRLPQSEGIRVVKRQHFRINPDATSLATLNIRHIEFAKYEPPATRCLSDEQLQQVAECPLDMRLPISSVVVERAVKDTTRAAKMVSSTLEANGLIQNTIRSRRS